MQKFFIKKINLDVLDFARDCKTRATSDIVTVVCYYLREFKTFSIIKFK
jgi:hypothetical protein